MVKSNTVSTASDVWKSVIIPMMEEDGKSKRLKTVYRKLHIDRDGTVTLGERVNL